MNANDKRWRACVWLRELVRQWRGARGSFEVMEFQRPYSRDWEDLIEAVGLTSAEARNEAFRDACLLEESGFVELRRERYRPYQIERVSVPFTAERRLRELFSDELPAKPDTRFDFTSVAWAPQLSFLTKTTRTNVAADDLLKLNTFLLTRSGSQPIIPIKERSLQIFGHEKRLDALLTTSLFRDGRLNLETDLRCELIGEPLAWKRGPSNAQAQPMIVIENAATWHSYCRWNAKTNGFSAVVYGCGDRFADGVRYIDDIFAELGGPRAIVYFGDLDPRGLLIPQIASGRASSLGLPAVEPHLWSYRQLFSISAGTTQPWEGEPPSSTLCDWMGNMAEPVRRLFNAAQRIPQEYVGWAFLKGVSGLAND